MKGQFNKPIWAVMISLVLIVGTLTLSIPHQEAYATSISDCTGDSSVDGERLILTANIPNFANDISGIDCIVIIHNNVTLDCKGFTIDGTDVFSSNGVFVTGDNVTIKNCTVTDFSNGILLFGSDGSTVTKNNLTLNFVGIQVLDSDNNKISANTADLNQVGLSCFFSTGNKFERNDADDNAFDGLRFLDCDNSLVSANLFRGNDLLGIRLTIDSDNNTFKRNTADDSVDGINITSDSDSNKFTANTTNLNTEEGIDDDSTGGGTAGTANTYKRNSCSGNTTPSTPAGLCS